MQRNGDRNGVDEEEKLKVKRACASSVSMFSVAKTMDTNRQVVKPLLSFLFPQTKKYKKILYVTDTESDDEVVVKKPEPKVEYQPSSSYISVFGRF